MYNELMSGIWKRNSGGRLQVLVVPRPYLCCCRKITRSVTMRYEVSGV